MIARKIRVDGRGRALRCRVVDRLDMNGVGRCVRAPCGTRDDS